MTLTIRLGAKLESELRKYAFEEDETVSDFVRKAIAERLQKKITRKTPYELGKSVFGRRGSGKGDLSVKSREYFKEYVRAKHSR